MTQSETIPGETTGFDPRRGVYCRIGITMPIEEWERVAPPYPDPNVTLLKVLGDGFEGRVELERVSEARYTSEDIVSHIRLLDEADREMTLELIGAEFGVRH